MITLRSGDFDELVGTRFVISDLDGDDLLVLVRVETMDSPPGMEQFSLVFSGSAAVAAEQRTYPVHHDTLGDLELFLVPIAQSHDRVEFEACFSVLVPAD